jgi:iron complex outermembrane receptor protein
MSQAAARYYGFEAQAATTLARFGPWKLGADVMGDYVHATIVGWVLRRAFLRCG